jgi:pimeloyl-ACP methyl ester carboxylesterase
MADGSQAQMIATSDGRELEVRITGAENAFPLVFFHYTPGAAVPFGILERAAAERGLRVVSYSRPGYGRSTPRPDAHTTATVADDAIDAARILDHLEVDQFVTIAWSGGGPRALACAAVLPDRCRAAATLACPVPPNAEGLAQTAGMRPENASLYGAIAWGKESFTAILEQQVAPLLSVTDEQLIEWFRGSFAPLDNATLTGEYAEYLASCVRHSMDQGVTGWRDDLFVYTRPWGFDLHEISVPVSVWHGTNDVNLGSIHGIWLSEHIPGAARRITEGEGHMSLMMEIEQILDDLVEQAGLQTPLRSLE